MKPNSSMVYRLAVLEDIPELIRLRIEFLNEVSPNVQVDEQSFSQELSTYFWTHIAAGDFINWLAVADGKIVGSGGMCFHEYPPTFKAPAASRAYIMNVYTIRSHRKLGIASVIFKHLVDEARARKASLVSLHATNAGKDIYKGFGFTERSDEMVLVLV